MPRIPDPTPYFTRAVVCDIRTGLVYNVQKFSISRAPSWMDKTTFILDLVMASYDLMEDVARQRINEGQAQLAVVLFKGSVEVARFTDAYIENFDVGSTSCVRMIANTAKQISIDGMSEYDAFMRGEREVQAQIERREREAERKRREAERKRKEKIAAKERQHPYLRRFRHLLEG